MNRKALWWLPLLRSTGATVSLVVLASASLFTACDDVRPVEGSMLVTDEVYAATISFQGVRAASSCPQARGPGVTGLAWAERPEGFPELHAHNGETFTVKWTPVASADSYRVEYQTKPDAHQWPTLADRAALGVAQATVTAPATRFDWTYSPTARDAPYCYTLCVQAMANGARISPGECLKIRLLPPNRRPTADAGPDQGLVDVDGNGSETVKLDGTRSSDPDGDELQFEWTNSGPALFGSTPTTMLNVGIYEFDLTVRDHHNDSDTDESSIRVIENGELSIRYKFGPGAAVTSGTRVTCNLHAQPTNPPTRTSYACYGPDWDGFIPSENASCGDQVGEPFRSVLPAAIYIVDCHFPSGKATTNDVVRCAQVTVPGFLEINPQACTCSQGSALCCGSRSGPSTYTGQHCPHFN